MPDFSVVIPTRDRCARLEQTLVCVEAQRDCPDFEIIVVDDGSSDDTAEHLSRRAWSRPHQVQHLASSGGPARARNAGVAGASGEYVAFLGDDTQPTPGWLAAHASAHRAGERAVIGRIQWPRSIKPTAFMRYVAERGPQFGFALIDDATDLHFRFFYASNLSLRREHLRREPFDESLRAAAWEDIELGYRLHQGGLRFIYEARAVVEHDHPTDVDGFLARQFRVGEAAPAFVRLHPELGALAQVGANGPASPSHGGLVAAMLLLARGTQQLPIPLQPVWAFLCREYVRAGLQSAWERGQHG